MHNGYGIALAWPDTKCKQAGAWYDRMMSFIGFNKNGYYKVGHAALLLIDDETKSCKYYDFGRYHSPHGHGRVRSLATDFDLKIQTKIIYNNGEIVNLRDILDELQKNKSTYGTGMIHSSTLRLKVNECEAYINTLQGKDWVPYGPFITKGTNCSRFVCNALLKGIPARKSKIALRFPLTLSPTPMWNLYATFNPIIKHRYEQNTYSTKIA
jgi:hypothetical protein